MNYDIDPWAGTLVMSVALTLMLSLSANAARAQTPIPVAYTDSVVAAPDLGTRTVTVKLTKPLAVERAVSALTAQGLTIAAGGTDGVVSSEPTQQRAITTMLVFSYQMVITTVDSAASLVTITGHCKEVPLTRYAHLTKDDQVRYVLSQVVPTLNGLAAKVEGAR